MMELFASYGFFIFYLYMVVISSGILWMVMYVSGIGVVFSEEETGIASFRKWSFFIFIVSCVLQWVLLTRANHDVIVMWTALPPIPSFG